MQKYWGRDFSRRAILRAGGAFAGAVALDRLSPFTAEARAEILAKAAAYQDRPIKLKAIQPIAATADASPQGLALQEVYNRFMDAHPDISVEFTYSPWPQFTQSLSVAIGGGNAPDVASWIDDQRIPALAANGFLRSVDDLAAADNLSLSDIDPVALSSNQFGGKLYGVPYYWDARILFHNTDHFSAAGITAPPTTWDEAVQLGHELDQKDGDSYTRIGYVPLSPSNLVGFGGGGNSFLFIYGWQNGGKFVSDDLTKVTVNDPAIVAALEWCVEVSDSYGGAEEQSNFMQQAAKGGNAFPTGAVSMMTNTTGFGSNTVNPANSGVNWAVSPAPYKTTPATWSGVLSVALPVGSQHPDEAWELAKFIQAPEQVTYFAEQLGWIPTRRALWESIPSLTTNVETALGLQVFDTTHIRPPLPNSQQLWDEILAASDAALYHQATPQEALDAANAKIQDGLDQLLKSS